MNDFNQQVIEEFRGNEGRVGGGFAGAPMVLLHHVGRKSGQEYVTPLVYLPGDDGTIYVFASKGGAPVNPEWYGNLTAAGKVTAEVGPDTYSASVTELAGDERDRVYAQQAQKMPGFAEYAEKTAGIRTIPVLKLDRL